MRDTIPKLFFCVGFLTIPSTVTTGLAVAAEMVIVEGGHPRATIVVAKDTAGPAKQKIKAAAEELHSYVRKISGVKLPIVDDTQNPAGLKHMPCNQPDGFSRKGGQCETF